MDGRNKCNKSGRDRDLMASGFNVMPALVGDKRGDDSGQLVQKVLVQKVIG